MSPFAAAERECIKEAVPDQPERDRREYRSACPSVSKRPFPTSQSRPSAAGRRASECIKEAVPDQPEPSAAVILCYLRVYQRGRSRPARASVLQAMCDGESVSKRPFPTSQSADVWRGTHESECIKEAVPDQPEPASASALIRSRVYQRGRSRPARAAPRI